MANADYDDLVATTIKHYVPKLEEQVFTSKPLLWILKAAGAIKDFTGTHLVQPLLYAEAPNVGSYADDETFATAANTGISAAEFPFRQYYGLTHFTGIELAKNSGKEAVLSLLDSRMTQLEMTMAENINTMLFGDGTGNSNKDFLGLEVLVDATSTVGGIDSSSNAYWQSYANAVGGALTVADMRTAYNTVSEGNDQPTNIVTTQTQFEAYENLLDDNRRYVDNDTADAGFLNLMFKGAPIVFDRACTSGAMYFLNTKYLTLGKLNGVWFTPSDWLVPVNADVKYKHIKLYGNFVVSNRSRQGVLTGLT